MTPPQSKALLGYILNAPLQPGYQSRWSSGSLSTELDAASEQGPVGDDALRCEDASRGSGATLRGPQLRGSSSRLGPGICEQCGRVLITRPDHFDLCTSCWKGLCPDCSETCPLCFGSYCAGFCQCGCQVDRLAAAASLVDVPSRTEYAELQYTYLSPAEREDRVHRSRTDIARDLLVEHSARLAAERKAQAVDALKNIGYNVSHVLGTGKPAAGPTMAGRSALMNMPALTSFSGEELATSAAVFKGRAKAHELREQIPKINNPKGGGKAPKDEP